MMQAVNAMQAQILGDIPDPKPLFDPQNQDHYDAWLQNRKEKHMAFFPFTDSFVACVYILLSDISENQRERFTTSLSLRGIRMHN